MRSELNEWTLNGFVDYFDFFHRNMLDHKFVWVLGAGTSLASGIPLGSQLVDAWLRELYTREGSSTESIEEWADEENLGIKEFEYEERAYYYSKVFQRRFRDYPEEGYAYLESVMANADPSPGYSILASVLAGELPDRPPRHNAVITTNFDNLVADALSIYTDSFPFVCGHESLTPFVRVAMRRPLVCKIHRDLLLAPQSDPRSLKRLHDAWGTALRSLFEHYTPLVIGYGGNDDTLMDLLESMQPEDIKGQLIWCYYEKSRPSNRVVNLVAGLQGVLVPSPDFDLLMVLLGEKMNINLLDDEIDLRAKARTQKYRERIYYLDTVEHPEVTRALNTTFSKSKGIWNWQQKIRLEADLKRRDVVYQQALEHNPESSLLLVDYANFKTDELARHDEAEQIYREALKIAPKSPGALNMLAIFLICVRKQYEEAQQLIETAAGFDPKDTVLLCNIATLKLMQDADEEAKKLFQDALMINPDCPHTLRSYANFLVKDTYDSERTAEAEVLIVRACELAPKQIDARYNYASLLLATGRLDEASRSLLRADSLLAEVGEHTKWHKVHRTRILMNGAMLKCVQMESYERDVFQLEHLLASWFPRNYWNCKNLVEAISTQLSSKDLKLFLAIGEAILDFENVQDFVSIRNKTSRGKRRKKGKKRESTNKKE